MTGAPLPLADGAPARPTLDLLLPGTLPGRLRLGAEEAARVTGALTAFLAVLEAAEDRPARIRAILAAFDAAERAEGGAGTRPAGFEATGIPARKPEVEDFDRYFSVRRIAADRPAGALLRGLLQTAAGVFDLAGRAPDLPAAMVSRQVAGFAAHARLMLRFCADAEEREEAADGEDAEARR